MVRLEPSLTILLPIRASPFGELSQSRRSDFTTEAQGFPMPLLELPTQWIAESQRESFRAGDLRERWATMFTPTLFDEHDLKAARNQTNHHFYEWMAAVILYEAMGYRSIYMKGKLKGNRRKREIFVSRAGRCDGLVEMIDSQTRQPPDLFLFRDADPDDWTLCEVKGPNDRLQDYQPPFYERISERSNRAVYVLNLRYNSH
jgi:VRR-NUC domain